MIVYGHIWSSQVVFYIGTYGLLNWSVGPLWSLVSGRRGINLIARTGFWCRRFMRCVLSQRRYRSQCLSITCWSLPSLPSARFLPLVAWRFVCRMKTIACTNNRTEIDDDEAIVSATQADQSKILIRTVRISFIIFMTLSFSNVLLINSFVNSSIEFI